MNVNSAGNLLRHRCGTIVLDNFMDMDVDDVLPKSNVGRIPTGKLPTGSPNSQANVHLTSEQCQENLLLKYCDMNHEPFVL